VVVPSGVSGPRPLVLFGHGLSGSKRDLVVSAGTPPVNALLAQGFIVAATDFPQHGDRTWCFASTDCGTGALGSGGDGTCTPFPAGVAPGYQGDATSCGGTPINPGTCTVGTPSLAKSGQTFIGANFFRTRDAFRQNLIDQSALALALLRTGPTLFTGRLAADGIGVSVDGSKVYWEGISLGGITGTTVLATNPRFSRGVTAVAGGTLFDLFTDPTSVFQARVTPLFSCLLKPQLDAIGASGFDRAFIDPSNVNSFSPAVAAAYGKTAITAKWILDPGEPLNYAGFLRAASAADRLPDLLANPDGSVRQPQKDVLGTIGTGDAVIPNPYNHELFSVGNVSTATYTSGGAFNGQQMHGLLGFYGPAQTDAATYLFDLTVPTPAAVP
jgi:hypothetical protein